MKTLKLFSAVLVAALAVSACKKETTQNTEVTAQGDTVTTTTVETTGIDSVEVRNNMEKAGDKLENAANETERAMEDAAHSTGQALEKAGDKLQHEANEAKQR